MESVVAFFDESGTPGPGAENTFAWGSLVVPASSIRELADGWTSLIEAHVRPQISLELAGIEAKASDVTLLPSVLGGRGLPTPGQRVLIKAGVNTLLRARVLADEIYRFLAHPPVAATFLAVAVDQQALFEDRYQYDEWFSMRAQGNKPRADSLRKILSTKVLAESFEYLIQRVDYLSRDEATGDKFETQDSFLVGDETSQLKQLLVHQSSVQAGLGHFGNLSSIVNRPWFGSSLHDPCLQVADWIAFTVRRWGEKKPGAQDRLSQIVQNFRGHPDGVVGRGIVLWPRQHSFPEWQRPKATSSQETIPFPRF
jgi:hypothetical protein